jgi:hypothetical protein
MSVTSTGPNSKSTGVTASGAGVSADQAAGPPGQDPVGRLFGLLTVAPVLVAMAWLLVALPLLLAGQFTPVLTVVLALLLAAVLVLLAVRRLPGQWPATLPAAGHRQGRTPWWPLVAVLVVALAFLAMQLAHRSQQIIVQIDPSSYMQFGAWISHHGFLPIPQSRAAFGGTSHGLLRFGSAAFYQVGYGVVPQFMAGLPMVLAAGFWTGGTAGAIMIPPLLGACGVLTFGGLAARLIGPRWAPLAALVLALSLPEQYVSRSAFSEPLAQILFLGGLCLVIDALASDGTAARVIAGLGGLALGLTLLVRIDAVSDLLLVIPYGGMLLLARRPQAIPLLGGLAVGMLYGAVEGLVLSRPYLDSIGASLQPLLAALAVIVVATAVVVAVRWKSGLPKVRSKWLLYAPGALAVVVLLGLGIRPYLDPVPRSAGGVIQTSIHSTQPQGPYWALSLHWVFWYIGVPAVLLAVVGVALLGRRCLQGRADLDAAALGFRVDHRHGPVPAGGHRVPALGEPQAGSRRVARLHPAGGLGRGLAGRLGAAQGLRALDRGRPGVRLRGGPADPDRYDRVRPGARVRRPAADQARRARPGPQDQLLRRTRRRGPPVRGHPPRCLGCPHGRPRHRPVHRARPRDVRLPRGPRQRGAGRRAAGDTQHPAGRPATGPAGGQAIGAAAVRRDNQADHPPDHDKRPGHRDVRPGDLPAGPDNPVDVRAGRVRLWPTARHRDTAIMNLAIRGGTPGRSGRSGPPSPR